MMFLDIILLFLSHIFQPAFRNRIYRKCFSQQKVSLVFFIINNRTYSTVCPLHLPFFVFPPKSGQFLCDGWRPISTEVHIINFTDHLCLFRINRNRLVFRVVIITEAAIESHHFSPFHLHFDAQFYIGR